MKYSNKFFVINDNVYEKKYIFLVHPLLVIKDAEV